MLWPEDEFEDVKDPEPTAAPHRGRAGNDGRQPEGANGSSAIREGKPAIALSNFDYAATLTEAMLLGNVAVRSGEPIEYDPATGQITNSSKAARYLKPYFRKGWESERCPPSIEDAYFQAWGKVGGAAGPPSLLALADIRRMLEFQIRKKHPELGEDEIQRRTAKRMYFSDPRLSDCLIARKADPWRSGLPETMERISMILEELGLRFHFTGGVAASYYGDPRFTQDLDLVIQLAVDQPETKALLDRLSAGYVVNQQAAIDAIRGHALFQAIDEESLVKIDFHVGEKSRASSAGPHTREICRGRRRPAGLPGGCRLCQAPLDPAGQP